MCRKQGQRQGALLLSAVYIEEMNEELGKTVNFKLLHMGKTALHIICRFTVNVQGHKSI